MRRQSEKLVRRGEAFRTAHTGSGGYSKTCGRRMNSTCDVPAGCIGRQCSGPAQAPTAVAVAVAVKKCTCMQNRAPGGSERKLYAFSSSFRNWQKIKKKANRQEGGTASLLLELVPAVHGGRGACRRGDVWSDQCDHLALGTQSWCGRNTMHAHERELHCLCCSQRCWRE